VSATTPTFRSVLRSWQFRRLLVAHGLGTVAQVMLTLALGMEVLDRTDSPVWISFMVALGFVPYAVCSGAAGVLADRHSRSRVLAVSSAVRAGVAGAVLVLLVGGAPFALVAVLAVVAAVVATPSYPALAAGTPQCVEDEELTAANALVTGVENLTWIAAPGLLGLLLLVGASPTAAVAVSTVLFVAAAVAAGRVGLEAPDAPEAPDWWREMATGIAVVVRDARVHAPMVVAVVDNFLYGYVVVAAAVLAGDLTQSDETFGAVNATLAVGGLLAMAVVNRLAGHGRPWPVLLGAMAVFCASVAALGVLGLSAAGLVLVVAAGAATLVAEVVAVTMLQRAAPDEVVARVFGVYDQLAVSAIAAGSLLAGPLAAGFGAGPVTAVVGALCLTVTLGVLLFRADATLPVPARVAQEPEG
jgi:MFS family permease